MPLNMKLSFAHSNVAAAEGAWPVMDFTSHLNICMVGLQVVMLGAPASLASTMVIGPHHAAVIHVGDSSEVGQRERTWSGWVFASFTGSTLV